MSRAEFWPALRDQRARERCGGERDGAANENEDEDEDVVDPLKRENRRDPVL
jgi:hypothetical protein